MSAQHITIVGGSSGIGLATAKYAGEIPAGSIKLR
jgi:NAD(P)-dependent dehydrogenase (short-subunit alcohol dehydrogenase family)